MHARAHARVHEHAAAAQGISINNISTVDTDYVLVEDRQLDRALSILQETIKLWPM